MTVIRPAAFAGSFYPADPQDLIRALDGYMAQTPPAPAGPPPKAIIAPHAGYVYSGPVAAAAYALLEPLRGQATRVVLIGPSHRVAFRGLALGAADRWATPLGDVRVDRAAYAALAGLPLVGELEQAHATEHSLEVHIPFLIRALGDFALVPIVAGDAPAEAVAALLDALWGGPETVIVVSSDLSHYLEYGACQRMDRMTAQAVESLNGDAIAMNGACGRVPVAGLLLAAKRRGMTIRTVDLRNSGDTAGPKDKVVGYGAWALYEPERPASLKRRLLDLARASIEHGLKTGGPLPLQPLDRTDPLREPGACFVTLTRNGNLRGCIGSPVAWRTLAEDVIDNAFKSAFRDPRFPPLRPEETEDLETSITVLTAPAPMRFADETDLIGQLRPGIDGLIIEDQGRTALFIPSVWEQLPDPRQFLTHLKCKAGMAPDYWSPTFTARRFEAVSLD